MPPIFDFKCRQCGNIEEKLLSIHYDKAQPMFLCGKCDGLMDKQIGAPTPILDNSFPGSRIKKERERK